MEFDVSSPYERPQPPLAMVVDLVREADRNELSATFDIGSVINVLSLDGDTPDGRHLHDRLTGGDNSFLMAMAMGGLMNKFDHLVGLANEGLANPSQERVVAMLATVIGRHIEREGFRGDDNLCEDARNTVQASRRPDLIPAALKIALGVQDLRDTNQPGRLERVRGLLSRRLFG